MNQNPLQGPTHYATEPNAIVSPKVGKKDSFAGREPKTVIEVFRGTVQKFGTLPALCLKRPVEGVIPEQWQIWTWKQYYDECAKFAKSLVSLNCRSFGCVNILGFNSPEWLIANSGAILAGCIAAGIYSTNTADACKYITEHSMAEVVVLEGNKQLEKYSKMGPMEHLKALVVWGEPIDSAIAARCPAPVHTWQAFLELGASVTDGEIEARMNVQPGNCSTLIYTSGTTGPPKAVMISHDNVTWTCANMCLNYMDLNHTDRVISYLPLSHIAAQLIDVHVPMATGCATYFCQPDALKGSLPTSKFLL